MKCQNEMNPQERFCSRCGTDSLVQRVQPAPQAGTHNWDAHVKVLAWIFIVSAILMAIPALSLLLIPRLMMGMAHTPFYFAGPLFGSFALMFISIPIINIVAGLGLLRYREWARILTVVLAAFMLIAIPFGTAIGIYAFWVLLSNEGSASYKRGIPSSEGALTYSAHPVP
jgi:hypothetical protein